MGKTAAEVHREIAELRKDTDKLVVELGSRARDALDLRSQVRRHPLITAGTGIAVVGGLVLIGYASYGRLKAQRTREVPASRRLGRAKEVFAGQGKKFNGRTSLESKERSGENLLKRILYAALTAGMVALATFMARRVVDTIWSKTLQERPPGGIVDKFA